jgi:SAM-dependent methyltransferase
LPELAPAPNEALSFLCGNWRIFQLVNGHKWSLDDHLTAFYALQTAGSLRVRRHLDIGCGCGSVLLMAAWGLPPDATCVGVEAQAVSVGLARRSVAFNVGQEGARVSVIEGDARQVVASLGRFDLITGTPPYLPLASGIASERPQKRGCALETRGGIEAYCAAAAEALAPGGRFVVCAGVQGQPAGRSRRAAEAAGASPCAAPRRNLRTCTRTRTAFGLLPERSNPQTPPRRPGGTARRVRHPAGGQAALVRRFRDEASSRH